MSAIITLEEERAKDGTITRRWVPYLHPVIEPGTHLVTDAAGNPIIETPGAVREVSGSGKKKIMEPAPFRILVRPHDQMHATRYLQARAELRRRDWLPDGSVVPVAEFERLRRSRMGARS